MRTIEVGLEVGSDKVDEVIRKINDIYPDLKTRIEGNKVSVSGDLGNYKKRWMVMWILSGGKHGKNIEDFIKLQN